MAFQQESIYLNLQKDLHSIKYENVNEQKHQDSEEGKFSKVHKLIDENELASNTILFFKEKEILLRDIENICGYFK